MTPKNNISNGAHTGAQPLPVISGQLDARYLSNALRRAGRSTAVDDVEIKELTDGRQSNKVLSVKSKSAGAFVLKTFPLPNWRDAIFGAHKGEIALWRAGVTEDMLSPLHCPTIDIAHHAHQNEEWMLMEDVSRGIMGRGMYDEERLKWLLKALAALHARYWAKTETLALIPLISLETHIEYFAEPIAALGGRIPAEGWVKDAIKNITVLKPLVPIFLDALDADAEFYLDLCQYRDNWVRALAQSPQTLIHGDIRRANVAPITEDKVSLFDWDMAARAPAACDLAWFWFLHFWCYPPQDGLDIADREPLREYYIEHLASLLGERFNRKDFDRAWDLSWLKSFVQLGFCLIDPIAGPHDREILEKVLGRIHRAVDEAKRITEKYAL